MLEKYNISRYYLKRIKAFFLHQYFIKLLVCKVVTKLFITRSFFFFCVRSIYTIMVYKINFTDDFWSAS